MLLLLLIAAPVSAASASTNTPASYIEITSYDISPEVFMKGDIGTVTVKIMNTGTESVEIKRAALFSNELETLNEEAYSTVGTIGPGTEREFTFTIRAACPDGIYYPRFYLSFAAGGSMSQPIPVKVESTPLEISIIDVPDEFQENVRDQVTLLVGNPRENVANGVVVKPGSSSATFYKNSQFVGELQSDSSEEVSFDVVPSGSGEIIFTVDYRNGMNLHTATQTLSYDIGESKKNAEMYINNVEVSSGSGIYTVDGDVTNAGLKTAKSVIITTDSPAVPADPNRLYVVGELEPDDFSSFEITFTASGVTDAPLLVIYKDEDGNSYQERFSVSLGSYQTGVQTGTDSGDGGFPLLLTVLIVVIAACVGGAIYYSWKRQEGI